MKVLQLVKTAKGASWALRQIRVLQEAGVTVELAIPHDGPLIPQYQALGITLHDLQTDIAALRNPLKFWRARQRLRAIVAQGGFDLIHSHFVGTTLFMRLALSRRHKVKRIFQVPGPLHLENALTRRVEIATAGPRDYWLASCKKTRAIYEEEGIAPNRIGLAYYGVEMTALDAGTPTGLRAMLGLAPSTRIIGMVAYIYRPKRWLGQTRGIKGHEDLIDAVALLRAQGHDVACVFVGGAWRRAEAYEAQLRAYAAEKLGDRAIFLGNRSDVASLYRDFDVAVHPSHSENVGGAAESMPLGVPTVATNIGGFPDLIIPGETGWLAEPKNPASLAAAIADALSDPAEAARRAANGKTLSRQIFDVNGTARDVEKFYREILA